MKSLSEFAPRVLSILRIMAGLLFLEHGTQKLLGFPHAGPPPPPRGAMGGAMGGMMGPPPGGVPHFHLFSLFGIGGVLEFFGGILIVLGLFSRPVAFLLSGEMAIGYFMVHAPRGFFPMANAGEPAILFCFVFLYLTFAGGGSWSCDAMIARKPSVTPA